jgi:hypothetical protein
MEPIALDAVVAACDGGKAAGERSRVLAAALGIAVAHDGVSVLVDPREEVVLELLFDCVELARGLGLTAAKTARLLDLHRQVVRAMGGGSGGEAAGSRAGSARPSSPPAWATPLGASPPSSPAPESAAPVAPARAGVASGVAATGRSAATSVAFSLPGADASARPRSAGGGGGGGSVAAGGGTSLAVSAHPSGAAGGGGGGLGVPHAGLELLPPLTSAEAAATALERGLRRLTVSGFDDRDAGAATHLTLDEVAAVWK